MGPSLVFLKIRQLSTYIPVFLYKNRDLNEIYSFRPDDLYPIEEIYQILKYFGKKHITNI